MANTGLGDFPVLTTRITRQTLTSTNGASVVLRDSFFDMVISGTASITEANDTLVSTGALGIVGTGSTTEDSDTALSTGVLAITGTASVTEASDTLTATATLTISGTLAITEANDVVAATSTADISGVLSITEASDTAVSTGTLAIVGSLLVTEADDTLTSNSAVVINGTASITETGDTLIAAGADASIVIVELDALVVDARTILHTAERRFVVWTITDREDYPYLITEARVILETVPPRNRELRIEV